ncbi:response regulator [Bradyrhizobium sp. HKCCYLS1011]|uniref:response regulator n=1 Tax=Bradyrhizobium sp. HKCCYLS1011 TaxID=3420733 RepID=UPI003EBD4D5B
MSSMLLAGRSVLVIEDDYYLADDARQTLEDAGASVLGPVSSMEDALDLLDQTNPDCALVDINLGAGPSFASARAIRSRNIPLIFLTGYDASTIPSEFADAPRLQKPVDARKLLAAVAALVASLDRR